MIKLKAVCRMSSIALLVFIISVSAQTSNENVCRVALFCDDDSPNIQSRAIEMNSIKGDRGHPGYVGPIGSPGPQGMSKMDRQKNVLNEIREIKEIFSQKFAAVAQQVTEISGLATQTENSIRRYRDDLWGEGGFTASNGFSYKITGTLPKSFWEAKSTCQSMGGRLAYEVARNKTAHREIIESLTSSRWSSLCIDFTDIASEGNFVWGDGVPLSWSNWRRTEPNNANGEDCVEIHKRSSGHWNDVRCNSRRRALCERYPA